MDLLSPSATPDARPLRGAEVNAGVRVEILTVVWMLVEAAIAIGAGLVARSVLLTAFGIDSVIELVTGGVLLWRLVAEARGVSLTEVERAENRSAWIVGVALILLCFYILITSVAGLLMGTHPESSPAGVILAVVAILGMPLLAARKRVVAARIGSAALRGDAACSLTCAYMAGALLAGLALNGLFGWWWADSLAALALLYWLIPEAREAFEGARSGGGACTCDDDGCED